MLGMKIHEGEKELVLKAAAGVAVGLLLYTAMVQPVFQEIWAAHQEVINSKKRLELYKEIKDSRKELDRKGSPLATLPERSQLLGRISDIAGRTQIRIQTLTPRTEPAGGFLRLRMDIDARGSFFSLLKFLLAIEKTKTVIKVRDVSVLWNSSSKLQESKDFLTMQLVLETLLIKPQVKKTND